jgi:Predicted membrane protein
MRRMKLIATGLLILLAIIFCISFYFEHALPWLRIVRAFSEASMIGALADWFAVVVLFRHPLGIPIPHTAIVPKSKDRIGSILGGFVVGNFLTEEVIKNHLLTKIDLAEAFSGQLMKNADIIAAETVLSLPKLLDLVKDDDVHSIIKANILPHFSQIKLTKMAGGMLEFLTHGESFEKLSDEGIRIGRRIVRQSLPVVRRYILKELPVLWPERFGKKEAANAIAKFIIGKLKEQIDAIENDTNHAARKAIQRQLKKFIDNLNASPEYQESAVHIIEKIIANPAFSEYIVSLWKELKGAMESKVQKPDKAMKESIETAILGIGASIRNDAQLYRKINESAEKIVLSALPQFAPAIKKMIEKTVSGWSEKQIVSTLEPAVGRDLQFIRINGTIVGGLAGLVIYALSLLLPRF